MQIIQPSNKTQLTDEPIMIPIVIFIKDNESFDEVSCPSFMIWVTGEEVGADVIGGRVVGDNVDGDKVSAEGLDDGKLDG